MRLFALLHEVVHASVFQNEKLGKNIMTFFGYTLLLMRPKIWAVSHHTHHRVSGTRAINPTGTIGVLSIDEYENLSEKDQKRYRFLMVYLNYFWVFMYQFNIHVFFHFGYKIKNILTLAFHLCLYALVIYYFGVLNPTLSTPCDIIDFFGYNCPNLGT